jgi:hypothetical protein
MKQELEPQKSSGSHVIVSTSSGPEPTTVFEIRSDSQPTLFRAISGSGVSPPHLVITKNKTFQKNRLAKQQMCECYDSMITSALKTVMTEMLFIGWLQNILVSWNEILRRRIQYDRLILFLLNGYATHAARVLVYARSQRILIIGVLVYSVHIA